MPNTDLVEEIGLGTREPSKKTIKKERPENDVTFSGDEGFGKMVDTEDPLNFNREVDSYSKIPFHRISKEG
jgi:hypothetical protein